MSMSGRDYIGMVNAYSKKQKKYRKLRFVEKTVPKKIKKYVKKVVDKDKELKRVTSIAGGAGAVLPASISTSGALYELSRIPLGDTYNTRDGNKAEIKGIRIHGQIENEATDTENTYRLVIFSPKDPAPYLGRTFAVEYPKLFFPGAGIGDYLNGQLNLDKNCHVYYDKRIKMQPNFANSGAGSRNFLHKTFINKYIKIKKTVKWDQAGAAAGADESFTPIYIAQITDSGGVPNPGWSAGSCISTYFVEK